MADTCKEHFISKWDFDNNSKLYIQLCASMLIGAMAQTLHLPLKDERVITALQSTSSNSPQVNTLNRK
jgi:hypothetical protein